MKLQYTHFSDKGPQINNEDCCGVIDVDGCQKLFIVCDGMGGHACGEVASRIVCDTFISYWKDHTNENDSEQMILDATRMASMALDEQSGMTEMGTTMVMASIEDDTAMIAHAGDSRCYVIDLKGNLRYCTKDHVESSSLSLPFINRAFFSHQPKKAIPDIKTVKLQPLDRILLCTDGLYNAIDQDTLLHTLQCARDVNQVAEKFASICKERANDNYTAIIIEIG